MAKNPTEFLHFGRPNKVMVIEDHLSGPINAEKNMPMEVTNISRFVFTILDKSGTNPLTPSGNFPESDFSLLNHKAEYALQLKMKKEMFPTNNTPTTQAATVYEQKFVFGAAMKGKTVPEVLGNDPKANLQLIQRARELLQKNVERFPANQKMIDEINRAEKEIAEGKYNPSANAAPASTGTTIVVYKQQSKPLISKKMDVDGESQTRYLVYDIEISCDLSKASPWRLTIMNCYCPLRMNPANGQNLPVLSEAINKSQSSFQMTDQEFFRMLSEMETHILTFHTQNDPKQRATVAEMERKMRKASESEA